jgi:hypothetical protein
MLRITGQLLNRRAPTVDGDHGTGDVARARRDEEPHDLGELRRLRSAPEQGRLTKSLGARRVGTARVHRSGATALTRTPLGLYSAAQAWVNDDIAAFVAP